MEKPDFIAIQDRYLEILNRISAAALSVDRHPGDIRLVVVTKAHDVETAKAVIAAGAKNLGESYPEEGVQKILEINAPDIVWHMIGHVQSRKAGLVAQHYAWMHSLDGFKVARRLDRFARDANRQLPVLIECNVSGEESKFGFPVWEESRFSAFDKVVAEILSLENLTVRGLMTVPPWNPDPEISRPFFQRLRQLQTRLIENFPQACWDELSMGMSNDFEIAIQEGATIVRVGTAIVGPR